MKALLIVNLIVLAIGLLAILVLIGDTQMSLTVLGMAGLIVGSGALSAYLWHERGKVYEARGEEGPDG